MVNGYYNLYCNTKKSDRNKDLKYSFYTYINLH